jgi:hypothetical protein
MMGGMLPKLGVNGLGLAVAILPPCSILVDAAAVPSHAASFNLFYILLIGFTMF